MDDRRQAPINYSRLSAYLEALHYPVRLELLHQLRLPRRLGEIRVAPQRSWGPLGEASAERNAARETIRAHLDKLVEVKLVRAEPVQEGGRTVNRYVVNPQKLYELTEEMRRLSTIYPGGAAGPDATGTLGAGAPVAKVEGPKLVLAHGVYEGKAFPLRDGGGTQGAWRIGRRPGLAVTLDYDPFISLENSEVALRDGRYELRDMPDSKNGTALNWELLPKGAARPLKAGDMIGVGRSLLCFVPV